jgi:cytochrome c2
MTSMPLHVPAAAVCVIVALGPTPAHAAIDPAALFAKKCTGCHTYGKGDRVGPDLKGVTNRRSREWLTSWIRSSERTIGSGDAVAIALFEKYKQERMPDQNFSLEAIEALLSYFTAGGPEADDRSRPRHADTATPADLALGRKLFLGTVMPNSRGAPCASCHVVDEGGASTGATFGRDLTHVYSRFQDIALSAFLQQPCFPRVSGSEGAAPLTDHEAFVVKAFLRQVDDGATRATAKRPPR